MGDLSDLIKQAWAKNDPTGWFEAVYAADAPIPWALHRPHPDLLAWLVENGRDGAGRRAVVVGCGLGDDSELLRECDFDVTAFDIAPSAVEQCRARFPESSVAYCVADLFDLPQEWAQAFDVVVEIHTLQVLPVQMAQQAITAIASLVAPGGVALVMCYAREPEEPARGIPWRLSRDDLAHFTQCGLRESAFKDHILQDVRRFVVAYRRDES